MLTIGFSSHLGEIEDKKFIKHLKDTIGLHPKKYEIINIENFGEYSLTEVYNNILRESKYRYVVLLHNDVKFKKKGWGNRIIADMKKGDYGIMGLAGSTELKKEQGGCWWNNVDGGKGLHSKMVGRVWHKNNGMEYASNYGKKQNGVEDVVLVDGVFIGIDKKLIKHLFSEEFDGFHFYDLSFCLPNFIDNVKIGVTYNIELIHMSVGQTNDKWEEKRKQFYKEYPETYKVSKNMDKPEIIRFEDDGLPISIVVPLSKGREKFFYDFVYPSLEWSNAKEIIIDKNEGNACEKRNNGAKYSNQPYIIFVDDDIILPSGFLDKLYKSLKLNKNCAFSYTGYKGIIMNPETHPIKSNFYFKSMDFNDKLLKENNYISTMSLIDKKYFVGFDESLERLQDWDLWLMILNKYGKGGIYVKDTHFIAFYNDEGLTSHKNISYNEAKTKILNKYKNLKWHYLSEI